MLPVTLIEIVDARRNASHTSRSNQVRIELAERYRELHLITTSERSAA